jgi:ABC-2 type transport system permease protein
MFQLSNIVVAVFALGACASAALGFADFPEDVANSLLFVAWCLALLALFILALRLPLRGRGSRLSAWGGTALLAVGATAVVVAANVALYRHDVHLDVTREARNTPPPQFTAVVDHLHRPLSLTYFYNSGDLNALAARDLIEIATRGHPLFQFRAIDLDKEPGIARDVGVRAYNTAILQAGDHRVVLENNTDVKRIAYAALRALKKKVDTICFVTGHGETFRPTPSHFHFNHIETLRGHDMPGAGDVLDVAPADLDRLQLALTEVGYVTRPIIPASATVIPADCAVVAEVGPRTAFTIGETELLAKYLAGGGRLLLLIDPVSQVDPDLESHLLGAIGLATEQAVVIDPLNHFRTDPDKVAVPYYPPHAITERLALTVFPQVRPIRVSPPPVGVTTSVLAASSRDSFRREVSSGAEELVSDQASTPDAGERGAQVLAVAAEGAWPGGVTGKHFRLVLAGTSKFATNEYFAYVSNGQLAVAMLRWLAVDDAMPTLQPETYQQPEIVLTSRQMRDVFIVLEVLLPLSTLLCGVLVWWRRR